MAGLAILAATVAMLGSASAPAGAECSLGLLADLPLTEQDDVFVVPARINGQDAKLELDTGSFTSLLGEASADRFGLTLGQSRFEIHGIGGQQAPHEATVKSFELGRLHGEGLRVDVASGWDRKRHGDIDGLLGMNVMATSDIDLDIPGGHLRLFKPEGGCSRPTITLPAPVYAVRLDEVEHDLETDIDVAIGGHVFRAQLDSGAPFTALFRSAAERLGLGLAGLETPAARRVTGLGALPVAAMTQILPAIDIGDLEIRNMKVAILAQQNLGIERTHTGSRLIDRDEPGGAEIILGRDFLRQVHVWISHSSGMLVMQFPPKPSPPLQ